MIVTFGEALMRFGTRGPGLMAESDALDFHIGGTELNVAMALAAQGLRARWISCLPHGEVGDLALAKIARAPVDTSKVRRAAGRMGYYLLEVGAAPRPTRVIERQKSVLAEREDLDFDWPAILEDASWLHTTGITVGLSSYCRSQVRNSFAIARARNIKVSYDFNYRRTVWQSLEEARERQMPLLKDVDVLFCSAADLNTMFALELPPAGDADYYAFIERALSTYDFECVVLSERGEASGRPTYRLALLAEGAWFHSREYPLEIVDRIGAGDAMTAGLIRARSENRDWQATADLAAYCGALKHSIPGDFLPLNKIELDRLYACQDAGGLQR